MRSRRVIIAASIVALVAAIGAFLGWPRGATPVTDQEALAHYRSRTTISERSGTEPARPATLPSPGVYRYAATGQEVVKLGVLPAETRTYPDTMTVVIVKGEPSCFTATLNLLEQHTEETSYCLDDTGTLRIDTHDKHQKIGALSPSAAMTCDPGILVTPGTDNTQFTCQLSLSGGPARLTAKLQGSAKVTRPAEVTVANQPVVAIAVDVTYQVSGDLTGSWHEQIWFARENWLPLRIERNLDLQGLATFSEHSTLDLVDTSPTR